MESRTERQRKNMWKKITIWEFQWDPTQLFCCVQPRNVRVNTPEDNPLTSGSWKPVDKCDHLLSVRQTIPRFLCRSQGNLKWDGASVELPTVVTSSMYIKKIYYFFLLSKICHSGSTAPSPSPKPHPFLFPFGNH